MSKKKQNIGEKEKQKFSISDWINTVIAILTFLSVLGVGFTLNEMRIDRDTAYRPAILMNPIDLYFSWDQEGIKEWSRRVEYGNSQNVLDDSKEELYMEESSMISWNGVGSSFGVVNVGVGTAKDICLTWDEDNTERLMNLLESLDKTKKDFCKLEGNRVIFDDGERRVVIGYNNENRYLYLLPQAQESVTLEVPLHYIMLIQEILKTGEYRNDGLLYLTARFKDIQGKSYMEELAIQINRVLLTMDEKGEGSAYYQLISQLPQ